MKRISGMALVLSLLVAACGQAGFLDGVGDRAESFVRGDVTTTSLVVPVAAGTGDEGVIGADNVLWFNDDIREQAAGAPEDVIRDVWARKLNSRFIQASRTEIASALPTLRFPSKVPSDVRWVTSQLVFDDAGTLDVETAAAFGFWTADPYQSDTSRISVLRVGSAPVDALPERSDVVPILVPDGISLGWTELGNRYELFCRSTISAELCADVAMSVELLSELLP